MTKAISVISNTQTPQTVEVPKPNIKKVNFKADNNDRFVRQNGVVYTQPAILTQNKKVVDPFEEHRRKEKKRNILNTTAVIASILAAGAIIWSVFGRGGAKNQVADETVQAIKKDAAEMWRDITHEPGIEDLILSDILKTSEREIVNCIKHGDRLKLMGSKPLFSTLLYGPPGTGKTAYATAIGKRFPGSEFAYLKVGTMKDKYLGGSEQKINAAIDNICQRADELMLEYQTELAKVIGEDVVKRGNKKEIAKAILEAKKAGKTVPEQKRVFVLADEIDSIMMVDNSLNAKTSNDLLNEFKTGFTDKLGKHENITVFGCTNLTINPDTFQTIDGKMLDTAMLDRFQQKIFVDAPNKEQLLGRIKKYYNGTEQEFVSAELSSENPMLEKLCEFLAGKKVSFRDINTLLDTAPYKMVDQGRAIEMKDLISKLTDMKSSLKITDSEFNTLIEDLQTVGYRL